MSVVTMVLVFLLGVVVSGFLARLLPIKVPLPLLQIAIGACLSYLFGFDVALEPQLFLLFFIPPLLFLDGWRIPKGAFFHNWQSILALAIGLVVFTVLGVGLLIDWMIPGIPLAVAFALAAILSPTDPVAVSAMTASSPLPSRLMHILEGESLLNDATGLVCFSFAVAAAMTGHFSFSDATGSLLLVAGGGVAVGLLVTWVIGRLNHFLVRRTAEEPAIQIMISLLIPFAAYMTAEHLHVSGILAAAVAGIAMHYSELIGQTLAATRMQRTAVWDTVQTALNGSIFILLGEQLPRLLRNLPELSTAGVDNTWELLGYVVAITLALGALRFLWVWGISHLAMRIARWRGMTYTLQPTRIMAIIATAGVRGAITLAGILTLPLLLPDGAAFPARDLAITLAMGVILLSLLIASIGLPLLARDLDYLMLPALGRNRDLETHARTAASEAAIRRIEAILTEPLDEPHQSAIRAEAATHLLDVYQRRLDYGDATGEDAADMHALAEAERRLRLTALAAERDELYRLRRSEGLDDTIHQRLVREIDLMEASLMQPR